MPTPVIYKKAIQAIGNGKWVFSANEKKLFRTINERILARLDTSAGETAVKLDNLQQAGVLNSPGHFSGMVS
jgi:hypothetical protein